MFRTVKSKDTSQVAIVTGCEPGKWGEMRDVKPAGISGKSGNI
jgi:hypothetical protein